MKNWTKKELLKYIDKLEANQSSSIREPKDVIEFVKTANNLITDDNKEHFIGLYLNSKNKIIHSEVISIGHLTASLVHTREVFKPAFIHSAAGIIICHNHPGGETTPSPNDDNITSILVKAGNLLNITILDHIIFTKELIDFYSYEDKRRLE